MKPLQRQHYIDNNRLVVVSKSRQDFDLAMQLAFKHADTAMGWYVIQYPSEPKAYDEYTAHPRWLLGVNTKSFLVLCQYNSNHSNYKDFPIELDCETSSDFAWSWLNKQDFGEEPDHDGSNSHGFVVFNETWGLVGSDYSAFVAIGPAWAMHGK